MATVPPVAPIAQKPLTKQEWSKRKDKGTWNYDKYRSWWTQRQANRLAKEATPPGGFGQQTPDELAKMFGTLFPDMAGPLLTPQQQRVQAQQSVSSMIDPVIKNLTDSINARSKAGSDAITGYTQTAASRLGGIAPEVAGDYRRLKGEQGAVDAALAQFVQGRGASAQADLATQLGGIGADPGFAAPIGSLGMGAAGETAALGSAALSRLISGEAADLGFARDLPGFMRQTGAQELGAFQGDINRMLDEGTGEIRSRIPGLVENIYQRFADRDMQQRGMKASRAGAAASFMGQGLDRNLQATSLQTALQQRAQEMGIDLGNQTSTGADTTLTPGQLADIRKAAGIDARETASAFMGGNLAQGIGPRDPKTTDLNALRSQIVSGLRATYPDLGEAALKVIATAAIKSVTGREPGQNAREGTIGGKGKKGGKPTSTTVGNPTDSAPDHDPPKKPESNPAGRPSEKARWSKDRKSWIEVREESVRDARGQVTKQTNVYEWRNGKWVKIDSRG